MIVDIYVCIYWMNASDGYAVKGLLHIVFTSLHDMAGGTISTHELPPGGIQRVCMRVMSSV